MQAIIMAGGMGSRLRPLTDNLPKPMVPIIDKPVLACIIEHLARCGITDIALTLGYLPEAIIGYFGDGSDRGVRLRYYVEERPLGTAGGVKNAADFIREDFVVMSGDAFTDIDLEAMYAAHTTSGAAVTMAVTHVSDVTGYGKVVSDEDGRVRAFEEKPPEGGAGDVNMGIYILSPAALARIPAGEKYDFSRDLFPRMLGDLRVFRTDCYWSDIGTLSSYYRTNAYVAENLSAFSFFA